MICQVPKYSQNAPCLQGRRLWTLGLACATLFAFALCLALPQSFAQAETVDAYVDGTFYAEDMQAAIDKINKYRKEACDEGVPDPRNPSSNLTANDYVEIKWSKDLEEIARQRAAEACVAKRHARPSVDSASASSYSGQITAFEVKSSTGKSSNAENLAWNNTAQEQATIYGLEQWYGEKNAWVNQTDNAVTGHYTSLINPNNNYVGLACFISDCGKYSATISGEFISNGSGLNETHTATASNASTLVSINTEYVTGALIDSSACPNNQLTVGNTAKLKAALSTSFNGSKGKVRPASATWGANNSNLSISDTGEITGVSAGTTTVTATAAGQSATVDITVNRAQDSVSFETASPIEKLVHDASFPVKASAASGKTVHCICESPSVATVADDGTVTINGAGTTTIKAYTTQDSSYEEASASITLTVSKRDANLTLPDVSKTATYGDEPFALGATRNADYDTEALTYSSSNPEVATVGTDGNVTITGAGSTTITVTAPGNDTYKEESATLTLTVAKRGLEVSLGGDIAKTYGDKPFKLEASSDAVVGDAPALTYTSSDENVATVSSDGTVSIVGAGTCTLTVSAAETSNYKASNEATATLTVSKQVTSITVESEVSKAYGDDPFKLNASVSPAGAGGLIFSSSNEKVAAVGTDGNVIINGAGECTITATLNESDNYLGSSATTTLKVAKGEVTVGLGSDIEKAYGDIDFTLTPTVTSGAGELSYSSSDESVATVNEYGTVKVIGPGTCTITAESKETADYNSGKGNVTITVVKGKVTINVEKDRTAEFGSNLDLDASVREATGKTLQYESSDEDIASVDADGTVTAKKPGTCTITITMPESANYNEAKATVTLTVTKKQLSLVPDSTELSVVYDKGANWDLGAIMTPDVPELSVSYSSSNPKVATIDAKGRITVAGVGTCTLTASTPGNSEYTAASGSTKLTVKPASQSVTVAKTSFTVVNGSKAFALGASAKTPLGFKSSDTKVATVDSKGNVTAKGPGTCKISITAGAGNYAGASKTVAVTVNPAVTKLSKVKAAKKSFKASWKKSTSSNAGGYQIRWSTSKKMSKAKSSTVKGYKASSKTIKKLKGKKTYYMQVRVFKKIGGKTYYSGWSTAKKVKVK